MAEPRRYAVHDHPVVVEADGSGVLHAHVLDLRSGAFVADDHYLPVVGAGGPGVEDLAPRPFERLVAALRTVAGEDRRNERIVWEHDPAHAGGYLAEHRGTLYRIRRAGERDAVVVDGQRADELDGWPPLWSKGVALRNELRGLLDLARRVSPVTGEAVRRLLAPRATSITAAGPDLRWPAWADRTSGASDLYVELGGVVAGARIPPPQYGQYVDLFAVGCSPVDVEAVVGAGALQPAVKVHYDDPDRSIAYRTVAGQAIRVLVETRPGRETMVVSVHFP